MPSTEHRLNLTAAEIRAWAARYTPTVISSTVERRGIPGSGLRW